MLSLLLTLGDSAPAFVQASTSEIFGPGEGGVADEDTPLNPQSPYADAKAGAHLAVASARSQGLRATNLVLFGHTSPLHDQRFALRSLARQAAEVRLGHRPDIRLQDPSVSRDWGSAVDFVGAFAAAGNAAPGDFVIATGVTHALSEVASWALATRGAQGSSVNRSGETGRQRDFSGHRGDSTRASRTLDWRPTTPLRTTIEWMVDVDVRRLESGVEDDVRYLEVLGEP